MAGRIFPAQGSGEELPPTKQSQGLYGLRTGQVMGTRTDDTPIPELLAHPRDVPCTVHRMRPQEEMAVLASRAAALTGESHK